MKDGPLPQVVEELWPKSSQEEPPPSECVMGAGRDRSGGVVSLEYILVTVWLSGSEEDCD